LQLSRKIRMQISMDRTTIMEMGTATTTVVETSIIILVVTHTEQAIRTTTTMAPTITVPPITADMDLTTTGLAIMEDTAQMTMGRKTTALRITALQTMILATMEATIMEDGECSPLQLV